MSNKTPCMYAISFGLALTPICFSTVSAQERCKVSEEATAAKSNYTQQHVLDVGDVPGHQIRVFELHRTYANDKPNCENLKRTESWTRGYSDFIDRNGRGWGYDVISLENGDKIFSQYDGTSQTTVAPDGSKKSTFTGVTRYTGGTGQYQGIRGFLRINVVFDPDKNVNQLQTEGEYWLPASTVGQSQK
jgi:hypothetical protein